MTFIDYDQNITVSIPNGMEFYTAIASNAPKYTTSFNSQRDGILPHQAKKETSNIIVSIPNGMEFYIEIIT